MGTSVKLAFTYSGFANTGFLEESEFDVTLHVYDEDDILIFDLTPDSEPAKTFWKLMDEAKPASLDIHQQRQLEILQATREDVRQKILDDEELMVLALEKAKAITEEERMEAEVATIILAVFTGAI